MSLVRSLSLLCRFFIMSNCCHFALESNVLRTNRYLPALYNANKANSLHGRLSSWSFHTGFPCILETPWIFSLYSIPPLATEPSRRPLRLFGTVCRSQYGHRHHCKFFAADWRPSFLPGRTAVLTKSVSLHWLPRDFTVIPTCYVSLQS